MRRLRAPVALFLLVVVGCSAFQPAPSGFGLSSARRSRLVSGHSSRLLSSPRSLHRPRPFLGRCYASGQGVAGSKVEETGATNLADVLANIWEAIARVMDKKTDEVVLSFPACKVISNPLAVNKLVGHLEVCKDCCESFGSTVTLRVISRGEQESPYFQIKSIQGTANSDGFDEDDDDDWDILSKYADLLDGEETTPAEIELEKLTQVPEDDAEVLKIIRDWVNVIISDMGVCPFSRSADKAGLPLGPVHYSISRQSRPEEIYSEYWKEVSLLIQRDESDISTTLHILPNFYIGNCEAFTSFTDTLSQSLSALGIEKYIQLVFFHPQWVFRDGADRMGESGAANFARRSSFPMINILRTNQVRLAQKSIPTGLVYTQNEETLMEVGAENLQKMLVERDWSSLMNTKVDRRYNKLGKIAQMLMDTDGAPPEQVRKALEEQIRELEAKGKTPPSNRVEYEAKDRSSDDGMAF